MVYWPQDLSYKGRNASIRSHNNDFIDLELKIAAGQVQTPCALESTGKEGSSCEAGITDLVPKRKLDYNFTMEGRKTMSGIHEILCGIS